MNRTDFYILKEAFKEMGIKYRTNTYKDTLETLYNQKNINDISLDEFIQYETGGNEDLLKAKTISFNINNETVYFDFDEEDKLQEINK